MYRRRGAPKGRTPLHFVAGLGLAPAAVILIHFGAQVDVRDADNLTPMHMASGYANAQTLRVLVAAGADHQVVGNNQGTPTEVVIALGDYQLTQWFNRTGAEKLKKKDEKLEKLKACLDVLDNIEEVRNEEKWDDIKVFIEYGMLTEDKFYEKAEKFLLLKNTKGECFTWEEYVEKVKPLQTDKNDKCDACRKLRLLTAPRQLRAPSLVSSSISAHSAFAGASSRSPNRLPSTNPRSLRLRTGCWSFLIALASTWRTRSRVTLKILPTSSSV